MQKRNNYYQNLVANYSMPGLVPNEIGKELIEKNSKFQALREPVMPAISPEYDKAQIEQENKEWFPTHCECLRQDRFDHLENEYRDEYVYLCQDGPFYGKENEREKYWVAILAQPGVTMAWPIVMFEGEVIYFEWQCIDDETHETIAKGNVTFLRRGHRGGIYLKTEQLTFYRDVFASEQLLKLITA